MRSILRFMLVVVPTAAVATAVAIGLSRSGQTVAATLDDDLQRDLRLASSTALELAPLGQPQTTVSPIEAPPAATPQRSVRPRRSSSGSRAVRSRAPTVRAAPEPEVAESVDEEAQTTAAAELADPSTEVPVAPTAGGVALPRPTAIPVIFPAGGGGGTYDPGPGTVIRGGGVDPDHCQVHGGGYGRPRPVYRQPRGITLGDRIRGVQADRERTSLGDRVRVARSSGSSRGGLSIAERIRGSQDRSSNRGSLADRIRSARGRR